MNTKEYITLLFDRPLELVFFPKGEKGHCFKVPNEYLLEEHLQRADDIISRCPEHLVITIDKIEDALPDLTDIAKLKRNAPFSLFVEEHQIIAGNLIKIFLESRLEDLLSVAAYARDRVHPLLFNYALSVALLHRKDTEDISLRRSSLVQQFPQKFIRFESYAKVVEQAHLASGDESMPVVIQMNYTATDLDQEHRLAYFREDLGVNSHHWHWHMVYPFRADRREIVEKDRRGELFYYMHQQLIARYNFERLCNSLNRVERFHNWNEPIHEAYFPKLVDESGAPLPGRVVNQKLADVKRMDIPRIVDIHDLKRWSEEIHRAIRRRRVVSSGGQPISLSNEKGIDILGNMVESSILSPDRDLYGDLHNNGHIAIATLHDPDGRHLESLGVMGRTETALRDPIFYRWHAFIDDLFQRHKSTLPSYTKSDLEYREIVINQVELHPTINNMTFSANTFNTFWDETTIDVSPGMNFSPTGRRMPIKVPHLQHEPFTYKITVMNNSTEARKGTCRIFLAPKYDETRVPWAFDEQRHMFIELDKFTVTLNPGERTITRNSTQSSVTIPFLDFVTKPESKNHTNYYCRCGWPQHLLIPKGQREGMACQLFVMISNYEHDFVNEDISVKVDTCKDAASFCGVKDKKYPDLRSMGYPFDRIHEDKDEKVTDFVKPYQNMLVQDCVIKFWGLDRPKN